MLQQLTNIELNQKISRIGREISDLEQKIHATTELRNQRADELVAMYLPHLDAKVLTKLRQNFPYFMTKDLEILFENHKLMFFGMVKPSGYAHALVKLQAKFKAHLNGGAGQVARHDDQIREMAMRKSLLSRQLMEADLERQYRQNKVVPKMTTQRPTSPVKAGAAARQAQNTSSGRVSRGVRTVDDDDSSYPVQDTYSATVTQMLMQSTSIDSSAGQHGHHACAPSHHAPIATDDRLGCYS